MIFSIIELLCTTTMVVQESMLVVHKQKTKNLLKRLDNDLKKDLGDEYISDENKIKKEKK